jgi:hypothetical protein
LDGALDFILPKILPAAEARLIGDIIRKYQE